MLRVLLVCNELRKSYLADFLQSKFSRTNCMVILPDFPAKTWQISYTEMYVIRHNSLFLNRTNQRRLSHNNTWQWVT
jgi:hypothetical protein